MPITELELAQRIRAAREQLGFTQDEVAEALGLPRSAVSEIERGNRSVSSLELEAFARLYGRPVGDFLAEAFDPADVVIARLRSVSEGEELHVLLEAGALSQRVLAELHNLEELLEIEPPTVALPFYELPRPQSTWQAIRQGEAVAADERRRMGLEQRPVADPPKLLLSHGIRAFLFDLPQDVAGVSLMDHRWGLAVIVNRRDARVRRRFSWIHELAHVLMDRDQKATVTRGEDRDRREEVRANAFAAAFLMPEVALREALVRLDKARPSRERFIVTDGDSNPTAAERRSVASQRELTLEDVAQIADELGVSYLALLYRLLNLKLVSQGTFDALRSDEQQRGAVLRRIRHPNGDEPDRSSLHVPPDFANHLLALGVRAYRQDLVARSKVHELGELVGMGPDDIDLQLDASGGPPGADVVLPEGFE